MSTKTRKKSGSHMSNYLGTGKELLPSELPTTRDLLRFGLLKREQSEEDKRNYTVDQLVKEMMRALVEQWQKANAQFQFPVINHPDTIYKKVKTLWDDAVKVSLGRGNLKVKERFSEKLDKLLDILNCKCPITLCPESSCEDTCVKEAHIKCSCKSDHKIPVLELRFIYSQRDKVGSISKHQIGGIDLPESKRQETALENQENRRKAEEKRRKKAEDLARQGDTVKEEELEFVNKEFIDTAELERESYDDYHPPSLVKDNLNSREKVYNTKDISNIAMASMRHHSGLREAAEIATAAWIDAGIITESDTHLVIDHNKLKRAQNKLVDELHEKFENDLTENGINCILFDGRRDDTRVNLEIEGT